MQLTRLIKRSGKSVWLLVVVPVLAVAASVALLAPSDPPVHTLATVSVIAPEGSSTAATVTQAVSGFESTVTSDTVLNLASREVGVSIGSGDVTAQRVGTSNLVEMRLTTSGGEDAKAAMESLIAHANDVLFSSTITSAEARVDTAQQRYDDAIKERAAEIDRTGLLLPIEAYRAKAAEVTQLRVALAAGGPDIDRTTVQTNLTKAVKDLDRIGESVNAFESLEDSVSRSRSELGDAKQSVDEATTRREAATAPESVTVTEPVKQSARTTLARGIISALVVGLALGLGLVLLIGLLRSPDRKRPNPNGGQGARPTVPTPAPGTARKNGHRERDRETVLW
jgi:capsular polysaccharide biosynthesis protein